MRHISHITYEEIHRIYQHFNIYFSVDHDS